MKNTLTGPCVLQRLTLQGAMYQGCTSLKVIFQPWGSPLLKARQC
jgi:hypothetical protein